MVWWWKYIANKIKIIIISNDILFVKHEFLKPQLTSKNIKRERKREKRLGFEQWKPLVRVEDVFR